MVAELAEQIGLMCNQLKFPADFLRKGAQLGQGVGKTLLVI